MNQKTADLIITSEETEMVLSKGSGFSGGKERIYNYFKERHSNEEKADFLKNEYGTGGSYCEGRGICYNSKGLIYEKSGCSSTHLTWQQVALYIDRLIEEGKYINIK